MTKLKFKFITGALFFLFLGSTYAEDNSRTSEHGEVIHSNTKDDWDCGEGATLYKNRTKGMVRVDWTVTNNCEFKGKLERSDPDGGGWTMDIPGGASDTDFAILKQGARLDFVCCSVQTVDNDGCVTKITVSTFVHDGPNG